MIQALGRMRQLRQIDERASLAAPMLGITTRSNELNKTKPTTQLGFSLKLLSRAHNNPGQSAETGWIKKQRHQPGAHRPPSSESGRNVSCKPDQRGRIR